MARNIPWWDARRRSGKCIRSGDSSPSPLWRREGSTSSGAPWHHSPTPLISTAVGGTNYNVALIRGFQLFGTAISTNSDNIFYSNKTWQTPTTYASNVTLPSLQNLSNPTLNLGTSFSLVSDRSRALVVPNIGVSARYDRISKQLGGGAGIGPVTKYVSVGGAVNRDQSAVSRGPRLANLQPYFRGLPGELRPRHVLAWSTGLPFLSDKSGGCP